MSLPLGVSRALGRAPDLVEAWGSRRGHVVHRLRCGSNAFFLKQAPSLSGERARLEWLEGRVSVPRVVGFGEDERGSWLLTTAIPGQDLSEERYRATPDLVVEVLSAALSELHAVEAGDCPFGAEEPGAVLTHGDPCLPNVLASSGSFTGFVDLGDAGLAQPERDLAAAVWSLRHNLGDGWGARLLRAYGWRKSDEAEVERLRKAYESGSATPGRPRGRRPI